MLVIKPTQFNQLDSLSRTRFLDEVTLLLNTAQEDLSGKSIAVTAQDREDVEVLAQKAESFGLKSHEGIGMFLRVAFLIGSDFYDVFTPAGEVLGSTIIDEDTKMLWLDGWSRSVLDLPKEK